MKVRIGSIWLMVLLGCGQGRDFGASGLKGAPPVKIGEVRGQSSLGPTVLSLYSGEVDAGRVLGQIGGLDEVVDVVEVSVGAGQSPSEQKSEEVVIRNSPVYLLSSRPEKTELAAFVDPGFQSHLKSPVLHSRFVEIVPVIRYCSQLAFLGNDYLRHPQKCDPGMWCLVPQPANIECRLDSEGQTECQAWNRFLTPLPPNSPYSRANFAISLEEPRAFVCNHWKNGSSFSYRLRELKQLSRLRLRFGRGIRIKVETPTGQLDSGAPDVRWIEFKEEEMDFSWDR